MNLREILPHLVRRQAKEINHHHTTGNPRKIAPIQIGAHMLLEFLRFAKAQLLSFFRCYDEPGTVEFDSWGTDKVVRQQRYCGGDIDADSQVRVN